MVLGPNVKHDHHSWGQQVHSLMGTAVEGPDQCVVRFRGKISPDGELSKLDNPVEHIARGVTAGATGHREHATPATEVPDKPAPQALADCRRQPPQDSMEAEAGHDQYQLEQCRSMKLGC